MIVYACFQATMASTSTAKIVPPFAQLDWGNGSDFFDRPETQAPGISDVQIRFDGSI
jgi:hypothetical protein